MLTYGKKSDWVEDQYLMNQNANGGPESIANMNALASKSLGAGNAAYPQEVVITCLNKQGRVRASLSGKITLNIQSEWQEMFGGGIASMTNSILGTANSLIQWSMGATIQQPWMNRKVYKNTKPFSFSLPLNFVAIDSAKEDVVKPVLALVSFCYPRKYNPNSNNSDNSWGNETQPNEGGYKASTFVKNTGQDLIAKGHPMSGNALVNMSKNDNIVGALLNTFEVWEIPGPSLLASNTESGYNTHKGDAVDIIVGKMFNLGNCYLENVNVEFGSSFDKNGYPLSAKVDVKCTCADSVVCSSSGNILVNSVQDNAENLHNFINVVSEKTQAVANAAMEVINAYTGYYKKGTYNVQEAK